jgi:hypothetical protein
MAAATTAAATTQYAAATIPPGGILALPPGTLQDILLLSAVSSLEFLLAELAPLATNLNSPEITSIESAFDSIYTEIYGPGGEIALLYQTLADPTLASICIAQYDSAILPFRATNTGFFPFTATPPCCLGCEIYGAAVQLEYWPTPAPTPAASILVDDATNFT